MSDVPAPAMEICLRIFEKDDSYLSILGSIYTFNKPGLLVFYECTSSVKWNLWS